MQTPLSEEKALELAIRQVEEAGLRIEEQVALIERLKAEGHDAKEAERLLATFMQLMDTFTERRDKLQRRADGADAPSRGGGQS